MKSDHSISLGQLQVRHEAAQKKAASDERALKRAQDQRDASRLEAQAAEQALRDGTRAVLG